MATPQVWTLIPAFLAIALAAVGAGAQTPVLLRDINTQWPITPSSNPHDFVRLGSRVVFLADGGNGVDLWSVDVNTGALEDLGLNTMFGSRNGAANLVRAGNRAFFTERTTAPTLPRGVWVTDGTLVGTSRLTNPAGLPSEVRELTAVGNRVFFSAVTGSTTGPELYIGDGTRFSLVRDINPGSNGSNIQSIAAAGGIVFFSANDSRNGEELWRSDGTAAGTYMVSDITTLGSSAPRNITADTVTGSPNRRVVYFSAVGFSRASAPGRELWRSDGTSAGTYMVRDIQPGTGSSNPENIVDTPLSTRMFFTADDGSFGRELWRTDGSGVTAFRVTDIRPGPLGSDPTDLVFSAGQLFFSADDGSRGRELWTSSAANPGANILELVPGSAGSDPRSIASIAPGAMPRVAFAALDPGGAGRELWVSDASTAGTLMLADIHPTGNSEPSHITPVGQGRAVFAATGPNDDREVWMYDGTASVDRLVDVNHGNAAPLGSNPGRSVQLDHRIVFWADDGVNGSEPWITDGTPGGTTMLADVAPGPEDSAIRASTTLGSYLYFSVSLPNLQWELWRTDGTPGGTQLVSTRVHIVNQPMVGAGRELFFRGDDPATGHELWKSDGTDPGTQMVTDIRPGPLGSRPRDFTLFRGRPWFTADDGVRGRLLWRLDANAASPIFVLDFVPGSNAEVTYGLVVLGRSLLCMVDERNGTQGLWVTEGTRASTVPLLVFPRTAATTQRPPAPVVVGNRVFFVADTAGEGRELWVTDGTVAGTGMVRDIVSGPTGSFPLELRAVGDRLLFSGFDPMTGREPWVSDGTAMGTVPLADIEPLMGHSHPLDGLASGSRMLWFSATNATTGRELWRSDGTPAGTIPIADMMPGAASSGPEPLGVAGSRLVFAANEPGVGRELFSVDAGATSVAVGESCARAPTFGAFEPTLRVSDPVLGTTAQADGNAAQPGSIVFLFLSVGTPRPFLLRGCHVYLDLTALATHGLVPVPASGQWGMGVPIPGSPGLVGLPLTWQAAMVPSATAFGADLTHAVHTVVGN